MTKKKILNLNLTLTLTLGTSMCPHRVLLHPVCDVYSAVRSLDMVPQEENQKSSKSFLQISRYIKIYDKREHCYYSIGWSSSQWRLPWPNGGRKLFASLEHQEKFSTFNGQYTQLVQTYMRTLEVHKKNRKSRVKHTNHRYFHHNFHLFISI